MQNKLWSLISHHGSLSWFITLLPSDNKHPICLYYADCHEEFKPEIMENDTAYRLITNNPVVVARFFHIMCQMFIKHILGVVTAHNGLYRETSAYYSTVEQQGCLMLYLHLLLWIKQSLSPQELRDKILDKMSNFQCKMVEYLKSMHQGELMTGTLEEVKMKRDKALLSNTYMDPTKTLPKKPPALCQKHKTPKADCVKCD